MTGNTNDYFSATVDTNDYFSAAVDTNDYSSAMVDNDDYLSAISYHPDYIGTEPEPPNSSFGISLPQIQHSSTQVLPVGNRRMNMEHWGATMTGRNRSTRIRTCPSVTISTINPTQTGLRLNPGPCGNSSEPWHGPLLFELVGLFIYDMIYNIVWYDI